MRSAFSEKPRRLKNAAGSGWSGKARIAPGFGQFGLLKTLALSENQAKTGENGRQRAPVNGRLSPLAQNNIKTSSGRGQAIRALPSSSV